MSSKTWVWEVRALFSGLPLCISDFSSNNELVSFLQIENQKGALSLGWEEGTRKEERKRSKERGVMGVGGGQQLSVGYSPDSLGCHQEEAAETSHHSGGKPASQLL